MASVSVSDLMKLVDEGDKAHGHALLATATNALLLRNRIYMRPAVTPEDAADMIAILAVMMSPKESSYVTPKGPAEPEAAYLSEVEKRVSAELTN